jgi:hypothetical protein
MVKESSRLVRRDHAKPIAPGVYRRPQERTREAQCALSAGRRCLAGPVTLVIAAPRRPRDSQSPLALWSCAALALQFRERNSMSRGW